jgi:hypothetical protein
MAHYAFLDDNNVVTEVIPGIDETELIEGLDPETWYGNFRGQVCKRTSYNTHYVYDYEYDDSNPPVLIRKTIIGSEHSLGGTPFRGTYAGIGYTYDAVTDTFTPPPTPEVDL